MKSILITGASKGIGRATALLLAQEYNYMAICGRNTEALLNVQQEIASVSANCQVQSFTGNVADYDFVHDMLDEIIAHAGRLDVLINNAGISQVGLFTDTTPDMWNEIMSTNLNSVYNTCHAALPSMIHEKQGRIINISSVWGLVGASCEVAYSATKGAVNSLTMALAKELAPSNIAVNAIAFGAIDTSMNGHLSEQEKAALEEEIPYGRMATPEEAAMCIKNIIDMPPYFTGEVVKFHGGWI